MNETYCPNYSVPLHTYDNQETEALVYRARCKMWSCGYCANINRRVWLARIMLEVGKDEIKEWTFFTFTLRGKDHKSSQHSLSVWRSTWDKLMKRLKREYGPFSYVRVFETHKSGAFHVHMMASTSVPDVELRVRELDSSEYWHSEKVKGHLDALKLGYIHDCKPIVEDGRVDSSKSALIASYVGKYLTKEIQSDVRKSLKLAKMGRVRMIQASHKFAQVPTNETDRVWVAGPLKFNEAIEVWHNGNDVVDVDRKLTITADDYYDYEHYPNRIVDLEDRC